MTNDSQRIFKLENQLRLAQNQILALQVQVGQLLQNQAASAGAGAFSGGGGGGGVFVAAGGDDIDPGETPSGGARPGFGANWNVFQIVNGVYTQVATDATIFNPMPNNIPSGLVLEVGLNPDGTYSVTAVACQVSS